MKTREGNEVWPANAPIRQTIRGNSESICADCVHCSDMCRGMQKHISKLTYTKVYRCSGFEKVLP